MRVHSRCCTWSLAASLLVSPAAFALPPAAPPTPPAAAPPTPPAAAPSTPQGPAPREDAAPMTRSAAMAAYNSALAARRLDSSSPLSPALLRERLLEIQELSGAGRRDEVIAALVRLVESPRFADYADSDEGHAAVYALGDALASAGAHDPARGYLKKLLPLPPSDTYARRAVRRLAEIAIDTEIIGPILEDLKAVPASQPEETRGEIAYLGGRLRQLGGDPSGAFALYRQVTEKSRFWAQATYLSGLIEVERGHCREGENLFCKVADPARSEKTAPFFADEKFYAVRDLARLALGRVAHEQYRFDDSRYYYYLVPEDSERLAEALYESATGRYEKKDYEGARELLDQLAALGAHHRYEDEAWILSAYIDWRAVTSKRPTHSSRGSSPSTNRCAIWPRSSRKTSAGSHACSTRPRAPMRDPRRELRRRTPRARSSRWCGSTPAMAPSRGGWGSSISRSRGCVAAWASSTI